jgi:hypothetical protein
LQTGNGALKIPNIAFPVCLSVTVKHLFRGLLETPKFMILIISEEVEPLQLFEYIHFLTIRDFKVKHEMTQTWHFRFWR